MQKKIFLAGLLLISAFTSLLAEQITKVGVVDITAVYTAYHSESILAKRIEKDKEELKQELQNLQKHINLLKEEKLQAEKEDDKPKVLELEKEIDKKVQYMREYYKTKMRKIEEKANAASSNKDFLNKLNKVIAKVAESNGFSLIIRSNNPNLLFWTREVDITSDVIAELELIEGIKE